MIWRLVICFSLALASLEASSVSGQVRLSGQSPEQGRKKDYSGVVVWLEPLGGVQLVPVQSHARVRMVQKNKMFSPHVLPVRVGTTVEFPNNDPIFHNAFSNYNGQIFDIGLYPPGTTRSITFRRPGAVRVFCNIHAAMSAVIVVVDTPYFAVTDESGAFSIEGVPKGNYRIAYYYERATDATLTRLSKEIQVKDEAEQVAPAEISESGYLSIPHLNKYGKPYGPVTDAT